jgi:hypothetical protein
MSDYQFRVLDCGGMNIANHSRACRDDHEAMALARRLIEGGGVAHIWEGDRNVGQIFLPLPTNADESSGESCEANRPHIIPTSPLR